MPHIHTQPNQHDVSVTMFIICMDGNQPRLLMHMHRKLGKLMPPGGHVELDETPWAAVSHELQEETGYRLTELDIMQPKLRMKSARDITVHPQPFASNTHAVTPEHFHTDLDYLFIARSKPSAPPAEGESTDFRWMSAADVAALDETQTYPNIQDFCAYVFEKLLPSDAWEAVPATSYDTTDTAAKFTSKEEL